MNRTIEKQNPTLEQYQQFQAAFEYLNQTLFKNELNPCLLVFSRKSKKIGGYFIADKWSNGARTVHEIALNPNLLGQPLDYVFSVLAHEMAHQWRNDTYGPSRYHCKKWAAKMTEIGLIPSDTNEPGGKQTGAKVGHYIAPGGPFEKAIATMPETIKLPWVSAENLPQDEGEGEPEKAKKEKEKYFCPKCGAKVWGKPGLNLLCGCSGDLPVFEPNSLKERPNPNPLKTLAKLAQGLREQGKTDEEIIEGFKATSVMDCLNELNGLRPIIREWLKTEPERPAVTIRRVMLPPAPAPETEAIANIEPAPEPAPKITERFMKQFLKKNHPEIFSDVGAGKKYPTALMAATAIALIRKIKGKADFEFC